MDDSYAPLRLSTRAIVGDIDAIHLIEQKERLEAAVYSQDIPLCLDMSKAFLESVFKTVLNDRVADAAIPADFNPLFRKVKDEITFNQDANVNSIIERLANSTVNVVAELRNNYGAASHGNDGYYQNPVDMQSTEFIMSSVDGLASLVYSKHKNSIVPERANRINYQDFPEFNDWLDEQGDDFEFKVGEDTYFRYTASQVLFDKDIVAYQDMLIQYTANADEELEQGDQDDA